MKHSIRLRLVFATLLIFASAIPNLGNELNIFGSMVNFYRLVVVFLAIATLVLFRGEIRMSGRGSFFLWFVFLMSWIAYGLVLFLVSPYSDFDRGLRELLALLCGVLCFYVVSGLRLTAGEIETVLRVLFVLLVGMIVFAFCEIISGEHLSSSMFNDPDNQVVWKEDPHSATGFMYNNNDFSSLLTLMLPVVIGRFRIHFRRGYFDPGWVMVVLVIVINRINDANICNTAALIGIFGYLLLKAGKDRRKQGLLLLGGIVFLAVLFVMYAFRETGDRNNVVSRAMQLIEYSQKGRGGLRARMLIYRDAFSGACFSGFMGLGPGGFYRYYTENPSDSHFVDPHSLFFEILSEYGVIIFLVFILLIVYLFRGMRFVRQNGENETICLWGEMGEIWILIYSIVTFASSSYLQNAFHWTLLALICLMYETGKEKEERSYEYQKSSDLGTAYR